MNRNPLQKVEQFETIAVVMLGIILMLTLEPVSSTRLICAGILAGVLIVLAASSLWGRLHDHH